MRPLYSLAFLCLFAALGGQGVTSDPVLVTVYYESKCGDSRNFVLHQLLPAVLREPQLIQLVFIPFGKANVTTTSDGYEFTCQHGPTECVGNRLHACALALADRSTLQASFIACMMSNFTDVEAAATACANELGLPQETIADCAFGPAGSELLRAYGNATKDLDPPLTFVPTVTLNGSQGNQTAIVNNFWEELVKVSEGTASASRIEGRKHARY